MQKSNPKLTLVGAGPGDPELITLKGIKAIQKADVILYDDLINNTLLDYNKNAIKVFVGKRKGNHTMVQSTINQWIVDYAKNGNKVVRLKGGDPMVFGRAAEEIAYANLFNIETEVIPGISSYSGVAAQHKIPITKRCQIESFWVITGTTCEGLVAEDLSIAAQSSATVIVLMGMSKLASIIDIFKQYKPENYPVAIIQAGTTPETQCVLGTINNIEQLVKKYNISSPANIIFGSSTEDSISDFVNVKNLENIVV